MAVECPHDKLALQIAMLSASRKIEEYEKKNGEGSMIKKIEEAKLEAPQSVADLNKSTAEFHGITVEQLINSPNYNKLKEEFGESAIERLLKFLNAEFELSNPEGWAILMAPYIQGESL